VLKVFLRSCGLNEVANGGLSSFSLTLMVLAHLMQELQVCVRVCACERHVRTCAHVLRHHSTGSAPRAHR
jgi:DNA polymerase sigma